MGTIGVSCAKCGDLTLAPWQVKARICINDNSGTYVFRCPKCLQDIEKSAEPLAIELLIKNGVLSEHWELPADRLEAKPAAATKDEMIQLLVVAENLSLDAFHDALFTFLDLSGEASTEGT